MSAPVHDEETIFCEALTFTSSEARGAYLDEACHGDAHLRNRVEALLRAREEQADFLAQPALVLAERPADARTNSADSDPSAGRRIGPYKLLERIGEGGFGSVYVAEQERPVQRRVALKLIKLGMDTRQVIARFEAERQALAMMDHPHIARVLDAGATDTGRPYFVMELVKGMPITRYCDDKKLTVRERLELAVDVCHAVQHAHTKGIIHRDLKSSNVLVSRHDERPVVKIIDFGIAKATGGRLTDKTLYTEFHQLIGTPAYMSPEQAGLSDLDIDTRSDIYSLGVLLYELLTGTTPFDAQTLVSAGYDEMRRIIREVEPDRPSTRISALRSEPRRRSEPRPSGSGLPELVGSASRTDSSGPAKQGPHSGPYEGSDRPSSVIDIARRRHTDPAALRRLLHGDLDWIVMKCLEKDRTRRYETANGLAADVQRHLAGEPVVAAPPSKLYRLKKTLRKHRTAVVITAAFLALATGGTITSLVLWQRADQQRQVAERKRHEAETAVTLLQKMFDPTDPHGVRPENPTLPALIDNFAASLPESVKDQPELEATVRTAIGKAYRAAGEPEKAESQLARALELDRQAFGPEHPRVAKSIFEWAGLLSDKKDYAGAETAYREALAMQRRLLGSAHLDISGTLDELARVLSDLGRLDEAEIVIRESLGVVEKLYGKGEWEATGTLWILSDVLGRQGRHAEAEAAAREALAIYRKVLGDEHWYVARGLAAVADTLYAKGDYVAAEPMFREALEMYQRLLHGDHWDVATSLNDLANCLCRLGRPAEALPKLEAALEMYQRLFHGDHPAVAMGLNNLARCLQALGRPAEALPKHEAALEMRQRLFPGDYPDVAGTLNGVAECLESLGLPAEALPRFEASFEMARRLPHDDDGGVAHSLNGVARCLQALGRSDEALPKFEAALEMRQRLFKGDHAVLAGNLSQVADCLASLGRLQEALSKYEAALEMNQRLFPGDHPDVASSLYSVAFPLAELGRPREALPKYEAALGMAERLYPDGDRLVALVRHHLADTLRELGEPERAQSLGRAAYEWYRQHPGGAEESEYRHAVDVLSDTLCEARKFDEAIAVHRGFIEHCRRLWPDDDGRIDSVFGPFGWLLLEHEKYADAEPVLRECLAIREKALPPESPDYWLLANTRSMLGGALSGQGATLPATDPAAAAKFAEAEPLLLEGYGGLCAGLKDNADVPPNIRDQRIHEALARLVKLYEAWDCIAPGTGKAQKAAEWRARLDADAQTPTSGPAP